MLPDRYRRSEGRHPQWMVDRARESRKERRREMLAGGLFLVTMVLLMFAITVMP